MKANDNKGEISASVLIQFFKSSVKCILFRIEQMAGYTTRRKRMQKDNKNGILVIKSV